MLASEIIKLLKTWSCCKTCSADNYEPSLIAKYAINGSSFFNKYYAHTDRTKKAPERDNGRLTQLLCSRGLKTLRLLE